MRLLDDSFHFLRRLPNNTKYELESSSYVNTGYFLVGKLNFLPRNLPNYRSAHIMLLVTFTCGFSWVPDEVVLCTMLDGPATGCSVKLVGVARISEDADC